MQVPGRERVGLPVPGTPGSTAAGDMLLWWLWFVVGSTWWGEKRVAGAGTALWANCKMCVGGIAVKRVLVVSCREKLIL